MSEQAYKIRPMPGTRGNYKEYWACKICGCGMEMHTHDGWQQDSIEERLKGGYYTYDCSECEQHCGLSSHPKFTLWEIFKKDEEFELRVFQARLVRERERK